MSEPQTDPEGFLADKLGATELRLMTHRGDRQVKLARVKAPAGGQISGGGTQTGGVYHEGGEFAARARKRIRDVVAAWLAARGGPTKLAAKKAEPKADLSPANLHLDAPLHAPDRPLPDLKGADDAIIKAKNQTASDSVGGDPDVVAGPGKLRSRLTIRELKHVEQSLNLPRALQLTRHESNKGKLDADEVGSLDLDTYYKWANGVSRHMQATGMTAKAAQRLRDPKHLSRAKLAFLIDRLTREAGHAKAAFADTGGASSWYGDAVAVASRHLHDSFHNGTPEHDDLWGKLDKKTGRVHGGAAVTLAKLLVAATSGGMKPHANYDVAHTMMSAGKRHAKGSENVFKTIPENQYEDFADWVNRTEAWHKANGTGVTRQDILRPGTSLHHRALWYERVMRPMYNDKTGGGRDLNNGGANSAARYSGVKARYVGAAGEHFGAPIAVDKGKQGWKSPYATTAADPLHKTLADDDKGRLPAPKDKDDYSRFLHETYVNPGEVRTEKLPAVDAYGNLQPPGWTSRNDQVMDGVDKINAVVGYFTHQAKGDEREGAKAAAKFFVSPQTDAAFEEIITHTAGLNRSKAPDLSGLRAAKKAADVRQWVDVVSAWHAKNKTGVSRERVAIAARLFEAKEGNRGFYYHGEMLPGAFLLGPKFGAFSMNLHLDQTPESFGVDAHEFRRQFGGHLTADLWWSRDWNVMLGTLFGEAKDGKRQETPRGGEGSSHPERKLMRKAATHAAERAGLDNTADLQAVLWYYEQLKPQWFGVDTSSTSYEDGANLVAGRNGKKYTYNKKTGVIEVHNVKATS